MKKKKMQKRIRQADNFQKKAVKALFLVMPAVISFAWLTYLKLTNKTIIISKSGAMMLAPPGDSQQLALGLMIFTIGYLIFLFVLFFSNIKEAFDEMRARLRLRLH